MSENFRTVYRLAENDYLINLGKQWVAATGYEPLIFQTQKTNTYYEEKKSNDRNNETKRVVELRQSCIAIFVRLS